MIKKERLQAPFSKWLKGGYRKNPPVVEAAARMAMGPLLVVVVAMVRSQK